MQKPNSIWIVKLKIKNERENKNPSGRKYEGFTLGLEVGKDINAMTINRGRRKVLHLAIFKSRTYSLLKQYNKKNEKHEQSINRYLKYMFDKVFTYINHPRK